MANMRKGGSLCNLQFPAVLSMSLYYNRSWNFRTNALKYHTLTVEERLCDPLHASNHPPCHENCEKMKYCRLGESSCVMPWPGRLHKATVLTGSGAKQEKAMVICTQNEQRSVVGWQKTAKCRQEQLALRETVQMSKHCDEISTQSYQQLASQSRIQCQLL